MSDNFCSSVTFTSNLQPVTKGDIHEDDEFIKKIIDPFSLFKIYKDPYLRMKLTSLQEKIFRVASCPCTHADPGDYSFGTIIDENGLEKNICKCEKRSCERFRECRSDLFEETN